MCLYVKNKEPKIADKDIKCYKIVMKYNGKYFSPYTHKLIKNECINGDKDLVPSELFVPKNIFHQDYNYIDGIGYSGYIEGCMIHTFKYKKNAIADNDCVVPFVNCNYGNNYLFEVYECIIPKGTEYYEGTDGEWLGYASKAIKFVQKIY